MFAINRTSKALLTIVAVAFLAACSPEPTEQNFTKALTEGDLSDIRSIHEQGYKDNPEHEVSTITAIHLAMRSGHEDVALFLVNNGYNTKVPDNGLTPLQLAVKNNLSPQLVKAIIATGVDVNTVNDEGWTALHYTVINPGDNKHDLVEIAGLLIDAGADINKKGLGKKKPLHLAAINNKPKTLALLIDSGADVNESSGGPFNTPLFLAARNANGIDVLPLLAEAGAKLTLDNMSQNVLHEAVKPEANEKDDDAIRIQIIDWALSNGIDVNAGDVEKYSPLHLAAKANRSDIVIHLVNNGADVNDNHIGIFSPLLEAVNQNLSLQAIKALIKAGADVNFVSSIELLPFGSPLQMAIFHNRDLPMMQALIDGGANMAETTTNGHSLIDTALRAEDSSDEEKARVVALLLKAGADPNQYEHTGYEPLKYAVRHGHSKSVDALLAGGAIVNPELGKGEWSPLMLAANYNHTEIATKLINAGGDVNQAEEGDWTALHFTVNSTSDLDHDHAETAQILINAGANIEAKTTAGDTPLLRAANKPKTAKVLLSAGADINATNNNGYTPLTRAVMNRADKQTIELLIQHGADIKARTSNMWNALHLTVNAADKPEHDLDELAKLLIAAGIPLNEKTDHGYTPLHLAAYNNKPKTLKVLMEAGADATIPNKYGRTPLYNAIREEASPSIIELLIAGGADFNEQDPDDGWSLLHLSSNNGDTYNLDAGDAVRLLLQAGARGNVKNNQGVTPLMLAAYNNKPKVAKALIDGGVDLNVQRTDSTYSALDFARDRDSYAVLRLLNEAGAQSGVELAKYPARPAPRNGYITCNTRCRNGDCYRTYSDGDRVRFQAQRKYNPLSGQWEFDSGSC